MATSADLRRGRLPRPRTSEADEHARDHVPTLLRPILASLADRDRRRSEATLQAEIRQLLLIGDFGLSDDEIDIELEAPVGDGRRIDIEIGFTVIEVKRSLASAVVIRRGKQQLAGYLKARSERGQRYVGVLTDGAHWHAYHLTPGGLAEVASHELTSSRTSWLALLFWLEGVLATRQGIEPTPAEIVSRLGATSTSYKLDRAALAALFHEHHQSPAVQLKRQLWAQLLRSALGTQFVDDNDLFIEHTLMMNSASIIAHLVVGFDDVIDQTPVNLLSGQRFDRARIYGVVEHDFFDWTIEVAGGAAFVMNLARRLARFDWSRVEHDVLKVLYQSIIGAETRKRMGEYYTPDWLAQQIVETLVSQPLAQRVLDPACGSGTFLFHAVRRYLDAAHVEGVPIGDALTRLSDQVLGVDLHPVAVALARVTYLLAIGRARLNDSKRGPVSIPVYLGDSVQWRERIDLFTEDHLKISAGVGVNPVEDILRFPERLLNNASRFDRLVTRLSALAAKPYDRRTSSALAAVLDQLRIANADRPMISDTFDAMCRLHDEERNHIWSYYIRNLARPVWLAMHTNRVDVLVGNPPWLSYRHMPPEMQTAFRKLTKDRGLWHGSEVATHQDLSALFVARAIQQYLKCDGTFGFVLPNAVLDRDYFAGFRNGWYSDPVEPTAVAFSTSWDLRRIRPHLFPRGAGVVFGRRTTQGGRRSLPQLTQRWSGRLPAEDCSWRSVEPCLWREDVDLTSDGSTLEESPYEPRFAQGATIVPRMLFFVEDAPAGPLGGVADVREVRSARSSYEKPPWRSLPNVQGVVEAEFVRLVLLGENLLPYRLLPAREAVLPLVGARILDSGDPELESYPELADWWRQVEDLWLAHRTSHRLTLGKQLDFRRKLTAQLPAPPLRLVYCASGMHVAAAVVDRQDVIIEHGLYVGAVATRAEGDYLCAILNSPALTELVRPLMSYGKDERHVDKQLWKLPIPLYDPRDPEHERLGELGRQQSEIVAGMNLDVGKNFVVLRRQVREVLAAHSTGSKISKIVTRMLS